METNERPFHPADHHDPRMQALGQDLSALSRRQRDLDADMKGRGPKNDQDRFEYHSARADIEQQRLETLRAMRQVDPSLRAHDTAEGIRHSSAEVEHHTRARDELRPGR